MSECDGKAACCGTEFFDPPSALTPNLSRRFLIRQQAHHELGRLRVLDLPNRPRFDFLESVSSRKYEKAQWCSACAPHCKIVSKKRIQDVIVGIS